MRILFTLFVILAPVISQAQQLNEQFIVDLEPRNTSLSERQRANPVSQWVNYGRMMYDFDVTNGTNLADYFRVFLFPDSTVKVEYTNGWGFVGKHSLGQVLDPVAPNITNWSSDATTSISQYQGYTLDSIAIPYRYWRFQFANPDTVRIQVYKHNNITRQPNPGWTSGASYANVPYSISTLMGTNYDMNLEYLIDDDDTSMALRSLIKFPVGWTMNPDEIAAVTITYFPGNPYNFGDTIDTYLTTPPTNPINSFVVYEYRDRAFQVEPTYYNNELTANTSVRYNISTNGWNGKYIPGTSWYAGFYHMDANFLITFDQDLLSVNSDAADQNLMLFPNPSNDLVYLSTEMEKGVIEVSNVLGQVILTQSFENVGHQPVAIDVNNIPAGTYLLGISDNNQSSQALFIRK